MKKIDRRKLLRILGLSGIGAFAASVLPEIPALAASYKPIAKPEVAWFMRETSNLRELTAVQTKSIGTSLSTHITDLATRQEIALGDKITDNLAPKAVIGYLGDGSTITTYIHPLGTSHLIVKYSQASRSGKVIRTAVNLWQANEVENTAKIVQVGPAVHLLQPLDNATKTNPMSGYCPWGSSPCRNCYGYDGGLFDCCAPCSLAFIGGLIPGLACALIWCRICLSEHCNNWRVECCGGGIN